MKVEGKITLPSGKVVPLLGTANTAEAHAIIYSLQDARELIKASRLRAALERLRAGGHKHPENRLLQEMGKLLSDYKLFLHWNHPQNPDGSFSQIEVAPIDPGAWHGPN